MIKSKLHMSGFTLVELLVVIGILGVLGVTLLLTLNPAQAQAKARDIARIKDAQSIQAVLDGLLADNANVTGCLTALSGCSSNVTADGSGGNPVKQPMPCDANWLSMDLCAYIQNVPVDPANGDVRDFVSGTEVGNGSLFYNARVAGIAYEVRVRQENTANRNKVTTDGGGDNDWFETGNSPGATLLAY